MLMRDPGNHRRPAKRQPKGGDPKKPKMVKEIGMSVNDWLGSHPMVRKKLAEDLEELVREAVVAQGCPSFLEGVPYIRDVYFYKQKRKRDGRNMGKQLIDALQKVGVIRGDSDDEILLDRPQIEVGVDNPRIEVVIKDTRLMSAMEVANLFRDSALIQIVRLAQWKGEGEG